MNNDKVIDDALDDSTKFKLLQIKITDDMIGAVNKLLIWAKANGFSQKDFEGSVIANLIVGATSYAAVNEMNKGDFIDFCSETFDKQWYLYVTKKDDNGK